MWTPAVRDSCVSHLNTEYKVSEEEEEKKKKA